MPPLTSRLIVVWGRVPGLRSRCARGVVRTTPLERSAARYRAICRRGTGTGDRRRVRPAERSVASYEARAGGLRAGRSGRRHSRLCPLQPEVHGGAAQLPRRSPLDGLSEASGRQYLLVGDLADPGGPVAVLACELELGRVLACDPEVESIHRIEFTPRGSRSGSPTCAATHA